MKKIWIVEDDTTIKEELEKLLKVNGYEIAEGENCDLILMDVNLPGESGYARCRKIRQYSKIPIIFLTARDLPEDEILAFGVGADDFIRKPYDSAVLLARIARLFRFTTEERSITLRGLKLNLSLFQAEFDGKTTELTKNETRILHCLMQKDICTKKEIIEDMWESGMYIDENTLYVNISRIREKLADIGATDFVQTVRGVGYRL